MDNTEIKKIWPEWEIVRKIGFGSFGSVYEARRTDSTVESHSAIKVVSFPNNLDGSEYLSEDNIDEFSRTAIVEQIQEALREIQLMEQLKGVQSIVSIEDYKVVNRTDRFGCDIYIRMELLTPLMTYLNKQVMPEQDVLRLGKEICTALEYCEKNNIIHRDIKPENIFVNNFGTFKLGDFGTARRVENADDSLSQKGTVNYMAPEIVKGSRYDQTVDIYSLGLVLYRLLNGNRLPFIDTDEKMLIPGERNKSSIRRLRGEQLPPPCNASDEVAQIILAACRYDAESRFQSAAAMKKAIEHAMAVDPAANTTTGRSNYIGQAYENDDLDSSRTIYTRRPTDSPQNYDNSYDYRYNDNNYYNNAYDNRYYYDNDGEEDNKKKSNIIVIIIAIIAFLVLLAVGNFALLPALGIDPIISIGQNDEKGSKNKEEESSEEAGEDSRVTEATLPETTPVVQETTTPAPETTPQVPETTPQVPETAPVEVEAITETDSGGSEMAGINTNQLHQLKNYMLLQLDDYFFYILDYEYRSQKAGVSICDTDGDGYPELYFMRTEYLIPNNYQNNATYTGDYLYMVKTDPNVGGFICNRIGQYSFESYNAVIGQSAISFNSAMYQLSSEEALLSEAKIDYGYGCYMTYDCYDGLRMKSGPSANYSRILTIPDNTIVQVTSIQNGWGYTQYNGYAGWINLYYTKAVFEYSINTYGISGEAVAKTVYNGDLYREESAKLRVEPNSGSASLAYIPSGATIWVEGSVNGWYLATYSGIKGWIYSGFVR